MSFLPIALSLLISCGEVEKKTAIFLEVKTEEGVNVHEYADRIWIYVDPQDGPFSDSSGNPYAEDLFKTGSTYTTYFGNYNTDDDELEMGLLLDLSVWSGDLPVIELEPGNYTGNVTFSGSAFGEKTEYLRSDVTSPISFSTDQIIEQELVLGLLDEPIGPCNNDIDDDEDGYTDDADPDCESGDEIGFGDTDCNDGIDNDGDGLVDADDPECEDAYTPSEKTGCENDIDDDEDGYTDEDDPDCATGDVEIGFGTTSCNDGTDNDADGDIDSNDRNCDNAEDDDESSPKCENG